MVIPSSLINDAVEELTRLPGIGKKTALRLALHILKSQSKSVHNLSDALVTMRDEIQYCQICCNIAEDSICSICKNEKRDNTVICVVVDFPDIIAIENTHQYQGLYHVLGGIISPVQGIGVDDLSMDKLNSRINDNQNVKEIVCALSTTIEGNSTMRYIANMAKNSPIKVTVLSQGMSVGEELEYTDEVTLGTSIMQRKEII